MTLIDGDTRCECGDKLYLHYDSGGKRVACRTVNGLTSFGQPIKCGCPVFTSQPVERKVAR